jgi:hypothetical protein
MTKDYSFYRYYKGEPENPFDAILEAHEIDKSHLPPPECMKYEYSLPADTVKKLGLSVMFWNYERHFESEFAKNESSDWFNFFDEHDLGNQFMAILSEDDYNRPQEEKKKQVFELWLNYLFTFKLYPEYGGENKDKAHYYSVAQT